MTERRSLRSSTARDEAQVLADLRARLPGYVPGWRPAPGSAGGRAPPWRSPASRHRRAARSNAALPRAQLAFLDACGESQRPPQAARVPLVLDARPSRARSTLRCRPAPPWPRSRASTAGGEPPSFVVTRVDRHRARRARRRLQREPARGSLGRPHRAADRRIHAVRGCRGRRARPLSGPRPPVQAARPCRGRRPVRSATPQADAKVILHLGLIETEGAVREDLRMRWEYGSDIGWRPLSGTIADLLITDGQVDLRKEGGPAGRRARDLRAQELLDPRHADRAAPALRALSARPVAGHRHRAGQPGLGRQRSACRGRGRRRPRWSTRRRRSSRSAPRRCAGRPSISAAPRRSGDPARYVRIDVELRGGGPTIRRASSRRPMAPSPSSTSTGGTWKVSARLRHHQRLPRNLSHRPPPTTASPGTALITFRRAADWKPSTIGGNTSCHFLRARLDDDEVFGKAAYFTGNDFHPAAWVSPLITSLRISFSQRTDSTPIDHCVVANGGVLADVTQAAQSPQRPFPRSADRRRAARRLPRLRPSVAQRAGEPVRRCPLGSGHRHRRQLAVRLGVPLVARREWVELGVRDQTRGFRASGLIQFIGPFDHVGLRRHRRGAVPHPRAPQAGQPPDSAPRSTACG